jgi:hypothetical protein
MSSLTHCGSPRGIKHQQRRNERQSSLFAAAYQMWHIRSPVDFIVRRSRAERYRRFDVPRRQMTVVRTQLMPWLYLQPSGAR